MVYSFTFAGLYYNANLMVRECTRIFLIYDLKINIFNIFFLYNLYKRCLLTGLPDKMYFLNIYLELF